MEQIALIGSLDVASSRFRQLRVRRSINEDISRLKSLAKDVYSLNQYCSESHLYNRSTVNCFFL